LLVKAYYMTVSAVCGVGGTRKDFLLLAVRHSIAQSNRAGVPVRGPKAN
jgi:hypothetical protein